MARTRRGLWVVEIRGVNGWFTSHRETFSTKRKGLAYLVGHGVADGEGFRLTRYSPEAPTRRAKETR